MTTLLDPLSWIMMSTLLWHLWQRHVLPNSLFTFVCIYPTMYSDSSEVDQFPGYYPSLSPPLNMKSCLDDHTWQMVLIVCVCVYPTMTCIPMSPLFMVSLSPIVCTCCNERSIFILKKKTSYGYGFYVWKSTVLCSKIIPPLPCIVLSAISY